MRDLFCTARSLLFTVSLLLLGSLHAFAQVVSFPDAGLEAAIRDAIGKPSGDIYVSDLAGLTELDASGRNIADLSGIDNCTDLQRLYLHQNLISNLQPLAGLTGLQRLNLYDNQVSNVEALAGLTSLYHLTLSYNQLSNLQPLAGLTGLQYLYLDRNQISNLQPLAGLTSLQTLYLYRNQISNLLPLAGLVNLQVLSLSQNQIHYLQPLQLLVGLQRLYLASNLITDLEPLANMTDLQDLDLSHNSVSNIYRLGAFSNLRSVWLADNQISDISSLSANLGLASGDTVDLCANWLDLTLGSQASQDTQTLRDRGVTVLSDGQRVATPPAMPTNLNVFMNPASQAVGTWTDNADNEQGFTVQVRAWDVNDSWTEWVTLLWLGPDSEGYADYHVMKNGTYQVRVRAYNAAGPSAWTPPVTVTIVPTSVPADPSNLTANLILPGPQVEMTWQDNADNEDGFLRQRRQQLPDESWSEWGASKRIRPYVDMDIDTELPGDGTYQYRVRAYNTLGPSNWAPPVKIRVDTAPPQAPADLQAQRVPVAPSGKPIPPRDNVQLTWTDSADSESGYVLQRRTRSNDGSWPDAWTTICFLGADTEDYVDEGLPADGQYQYRIRAHNVAGPSSWADPAKLWVCSTVPADPTDVAAALLEGGQVRITWTDNADNNEGYLIQRRQQNGDGSWPEWATLERLSNQPHAESYTDTTVTLDATYQYRVRAYNYLGPSNWGPYVRITVMGPASAQFNAVSLQQVNGQCVSVVYSLSAAADVVLQVRNIAGRLVVEVPCGEACAGLNTATWNLRNGAGAPVPAGTYLCTLIARSPEGSQASAMRSLRVRR